MLFLNRPTMVEQETGVLFDREVGDTFQDPNLLKSKLPQPYRMIDKVLNEILEKAWNAIAPIEEKKERFRTRFKPPKCQFCGMIRPYANVTKVVIPKDHDGFVAVGLTDGLAIVNFKDDEGETLALWQEDEASLELISVERFGESRDFLIAVSDGKGIIRMFCLSSDKLFLVCKLREQEGVSSSLLEIVDLRLSPCCEYIALSLQHLQEAGSGNEFSLEVYSLPSTEWFPTARSHATRHDSKHDPSRAAAEDPKEKVVRDLAFAPPTLLLKLEQPVPFPVPSQTNLEKLLKQNNDDPWVPGLGKRILVTESTAESRQNLLLQKEKQNEDFVENFERANFFRKTFRDALYGECNKEGDQGDRKKNVAVAEWMRLPEKIPPTKPCFQFVTSDESTPRGSMTGQIMLCWKYRPDIYLYSLEDLKKSNPPSSNPASLWPTPYPVLTFDCLFSSTALVSADNDVIIWSGKLGVPRDVVHVDDRGRIVEVIVLERSQPTGGSDPAGFGEINGRGGGGRRRGGVSFWVVVLSTSGFIYVLDTAQRPPSCLRPINQPINPFIDDSGEIPLGIHKLPEIKDTFAILQSDWRILLYSIPAGCNICEISMPGCCSLHPQITSIASFVDSNAKYLFTVGHQTDKQWHKGSGRKQVESGGEEASECSKEEENDTKNDSKTSEREMMMCLSRSIFVFRVSDFTETQGNTLGLYPSTLRKTLSANRVVLDRMRRQDDFRDRLAEMWLERREAFSGVVA